MAIAETCREFLGTKPIWLVDEGFVEECLSANWQLKKPRKSDSFAVDTDEEPEAANAAQSP